MTPELTTVRQNVPEIAKRSVDTVIRMIDGKKIEEMEQIVDVTFRKEKVPEDNKTGNYRILHHFRNCDRTEEEQISETLDLKREGVSFPV